MYSETDGSVNACGHYYPGSLDIFDSHIAVIASVVNGQLEAMAFIEAGIFGPWGEWHVKSLSLSPSLSFRCLWLFMFSFIIHSGLGC